MCRDFLIFFLAAFFELLGCFCFYLVLRMQKSSLWLILALFCLIIFAFLLTKTSFEFAGKAYVVYGGIYIVASAFWLYVVEKQSFSPYDMLGLLLIFSGSALMILKSA